MNDSSSRDELFDYTHNMASEVSFSAKMTKHNQKQPKAHHNTGFVLIIRDFVRKMTQKMQYLGSLGKKIFDRETFEYFIWRLVDFLVCRQMYCNFDHNSGRFDRRPSR